MSRESDNDSNEESISVKTMNVDDFIKDAKQRESDIAENKTKKKRVKRKLPRIWSPDGEYVKIRTGPALLEDPDTCVAHLQERTLTLFKHIDPEVQFAEDPSRPLWKGVFTMDPETGYGPDQYYAPKQSHLAQIYRKKRPKRNQPPDNLMPRRDGGTDRQFPYWVDEWQLVKDNDQKHKQDSRKRRAMAAAAAAAASVAGDGTAAAAVEPAPLKKTRRKRGSVAENSILPDTRMTVIEVDDRFIRPVNGWMKTYLAKGKHIDAPATHAETPVVHTSVLKASPAVLLGKRIQVVMAALAAAAQPLAKKQKTTIIATPAPPFSKKQSTPPPQKAAAAAASPKKKGDEEEKKKKPTAKRERSSTPIVAPVTVAAAAEGKTKKAKTGASNDNDDALVVTEVLRQLVVGPNLHPSVAEFLAPGTFRPLDYYLPGNPGEHLPGMIKQSLEIIKRQT